MSSQTWSWNNQMTCLDNYNSSQVSTHSKLHRTPSPILNCVWILKNSMFPLLVSQDIWLCPNCCSYSSSTWWTSTGDWWWLRCLNESCKIQNSVEAKYFCAVAVNCRPSYLNFLLRLRQSCPDEPLKHRNIGKIPQKSSHISQFFELWNGMMDGWMNANNDVLISGYNL